MILAIFATLCAFASGVLASIAIYRTFYEPELIRLRAMRDEAQAAAQFYAECYFDEVARGK